MLTRTERGVTLFCESFGAHGVTLDGGFADYVKINSDKAFAIHNLSDMEVR